jgi:hypothetical protein
MALPPLRRAQQRVVALLRAGVPLSLLIDLVAGPRSEELYAHEQPRHVA